MEQTIGRGRASERGEGKIGAIIGWIVFLAIAYAAWNLVPPFVTNYAFKDKMNEVARRPRGTTTDDQILDLLMKDARERDLHRFFQRTDLKIDTTESNRRIRLQYEREVEVLPGWKKMIKFENEVDQPLVF